MYTIIGLTMETIGTLCIAYMALKVHSLVSSAKQINTEVTNEMKIERRLGFVGIILIIFGYILQIIAVI